MTHRLLPPEEWPRLVGTTLEVAAPMFQPERTRIVVVEDAQGQIVGCWAFLYVLHAEGLWIAEAHRGGAAVLRHLMKALNEIAQTSGSCAIWTAAEPNSPINGLLTHYGAKRFEADSYVIPMVKGES